jgi:hypothetical protein
MPTPNRSARAADDQRQARLDARLALYAQYASLVGDEIAAAWSDDPHEAGVAPRELARARAALAEHYEELRASSAEDATGVAPGAFGQLLDEAVVEFEHQRAVERALRAQLERLRPPLALPAGDGPPAASAAVSAATRAPVDPTVHDGNAMDADTLDPAAGDAEGDAGGDVADAPPIGAALLAARAGGVAGVLGGQYPGIAAGADATAYVALPAGDLARAERGHAERLDVRF